MLLCQLELCMPLGSARVAMQVVAAMEEGFLPSLCVCDSELAHTHFEGPNKEIQFLYLSWPWDPEGFCCLGCHKVKFRG